MNVTFSTLGDFKGIFDTYLQIGDRVEELSKMEEQFTIFQVMYMCSGKTPSTEATFDVHWKLETVTSTQYLIVDSLLKSFLRTLLCTLEPYNND